MATVGVKNLIYASEENQVLKGKSKPPVQTKRAVLKEVGNKNLPQIHGKGTVQNTRNFPEKKPLPPPAKLPTVKHANKEPAIQVKYTKASLLRTQHSRQSIGKVSDAKGLSNSDIRAQDDSVSKSDAVTKVAHLCGAEILHQTRSQGAKSHNETIKSKVETCATKCPPKCSNLTQIQRDLIKQTTTSRHDVQSAFSSTLLNCAYVIDIDKDDENDPFMLGMYAKDMYKYLREMEVKFPIAPQYLKSSKLTGKMRATLIDWLVEVHKEFDMNSETLFLTVAIIDRFLQKSPFITRNRLQLVGITAMFIACKYEEIMMPEISELEYVSDHAYSKEEILQMELTMVKSLDCSFGRPLPIHFLRRYSKAERVASHVHVMAKYIMEMGIIEYDLCHVAPSLLAAAALYISLSLLKGRKDVWSDNLVQYACYRLEEILPVAKTLGLLVVNAPNSKLQAIRKKYSQPNNLQVSVLPMLKDLERFFEQL